MQRSTSKFQLTDGSELNQEVRDYDAFPNAPGLSKKLGLKKSEGLPIKSIGWGPWRKDWYSICSRGIFGHDINCRLCRVGSYRNRWKTFLGGLIYNKFPRLWRWWVNR